MNVWDYIGPLTQILGAIQSYTSHKDERKLARDLARALYEAVAAVRGHDNMAGVDKAEAVNAVDAVMKAFGPAFGADEDGNGIPDEWERL